MIKGRSSFAFLVKEPEKAQALINEWLQVYGFSLINRKGEQYYRRGDAWVDGYSYFAYQIQNDRVFLQAWRKNIFGSEMGAQIPSMTPFSYSDAINQLIDQLNLISVPTTSTPAGEPAAPVNNITQTGGSPTVQPNNFQPIDNGSNFRNNSSKTDEYFCIAAFVMAVGNFLLILLDGNVVLGGLGYLFVFVFGARGLKTKKRGLAIAALILGAVSLIMFIIKIISALK